MVKQGRKIEDARFEPDFFAKRGLPFGL